MSRPAGGFKIKPPPSYTTRAQLLASAILSGLAVVGIIILLVFGGIILERTSNQGTCKIDNSGKCDDGNETTNNLICNNNNGATVSECEFPTKLNGDACSGQCMKNETGTMALGKCVGTCKGNCNQTFEVNSLDCPILQYVDVAVVQMEPNITFCLQGMCIYGIFWDPNILVPFAMDMDIGTPAELSASERCMDFISDEDPNKKCLRSLILRDTSQNSPQIICIYTYQCSTFLELQINLDSTENSNSIDSIPNLNSFTTSNDLRDSNIISSSLGENEGATIEKVTSFLDIVNINKEKKKTKNIPSVKRMMLIYFLPLSQ